MAERPCREIVARLEAGAVTVIGVSGQNAGAEKSEECSDGLNHRGGPYSPANYRRHGGPHSQRDSRSAFHSEL
jgi:hypothetical protein